MTYLYVSDLPFKNLIYSWYLTSLGSCCCKKQIDISFLCVCPLIDDRLHHNIVKVVAEPLAADWRQFVKYYKHN